MLKIDRSKFWPDSWLIPLLLALALLAIGCAPASVGSPSAVEASQPEQLATIKVTGFGEALGQPDEAQVTVGVDTFASDVNDATSENETVITTILRSLENAGIDSKDIQMSNYSLWAEQNYGDNGPQGISGYRVSNQVAVLIRDISKVGDVLAAVTAAGANNIYGVQFSVADPAALEAEAREKALDNARQRAESLAQLSGLTLGAIITIDETTGQFPGPARDMGAAGFGSGGEASTSISPGQLSFQSQVQVTFESTE